MFTNEIKITGKVYNPVERHTNSGKVITEFGLSVYAGKNKEGKSRYKFITCKVWKEIGKPQGDQLVTGKLAFDVWEKDGKEMSKPYILAEDVCPQTQETEQEQTKTATEGVPVIDDDIPF